MASWREVQRQNFTCWEDLAEFLELSQEYYPAILQNSHFPLNLPLRLAQKIEKDCWEDPILCQFLPTNKENLPSFGFQTDAVGDVPAKKTSKLLQKYVGRALLLATSSCAMNCRFCFRQHYDYETQDKNFDREIEIIRQDTTLTEIILSGGDPLSLSDQVLGTIMERLAQIPHLKRIRFHTRFPIGIPERIDESFLTLLAKTQKQIVFIIHTNHARELDDDVLQALKKIQRLGIPVLSQSVLLKGVNDNVTTLKDLFEKLADHGVLPYYLHQLDRTERTAHFEVDEERGRTLIDELSGLLSGYALPKYVREECGQKSKTSLQRQLENCFALKNR